MTTTSTTRETIADQYIAAFNESEPAARRALIARIFTEDATYVDPLISGTGHDGIEAVISVVQGQFPGHEFRLIGAPDGFADRIRFAWGLFPLAADQPLAAGTDIVVLAVDGRMQSVTGFLDLMPGADTAA